MTLKEWLTAFANKEVTAIETITILSGVFNPDQAVDLLALVNQIARVESGDMDRETFKAIWCSEENQ